MSESLDILYMERVQPRLNLVRRMARQGKPRGDIAKRLSISSRALSLMSLDYNDVHDALYAGYRQNAEKATQSLIKIAEGYNVVESERVLDSENEIISTKLKDKHIPPNFNAIKTILKMDQDFFGVDERLAEMRIRSLKADAEIKEKQLAMMNDGQGTVPIVALMTGLRTLGADTEYDIADIEQEASEME